MAAGQIPGWRILGLCRRCVDLLPLPWTCLSVFCMARGLALCRLGTGYLFLSRLLRVLIILVLFGTSSSTFKVEAVKSPRGAFLGYRPGSGCRFLHVTLRPSHPPDSSPLSALGRQPQVPSAAPPGLELWNPSALLTAWGSVSSFLCLPAEFRAILCPQHFWSSRGCFTLVSLGRLCSLTLTGIPVAFENTAPG